MDTNKIEKLKKKIKAIREKQAVVKKRTPPIIPPRYDDVFFEGIKQLFGDEC